MCALLMICLFLAPVRHGKIYYKVLMSNFETKTMGGEISGVKGTGNEENEVLSQGQSLKVLRKLEIVIVHLEIYHLIVVCI